jgi:hypothetical protein
MNRGWIAAAGAAAFLAAHGIEAALWTAWFQPGGGTSAWFLNTGRAALFTAACLALAGVIVGTRCAGGSRSVAQGLWLALGALAAMTAVLLSSGPGTLFPIVLAFGAGIAAVAGVAGVSLGALIRRR